MLIGVAERNNSGELLSIILFILCSRSLLRADRFPNIGDSGVLLLVGGMGDGSRKGAPIIGERVGEGSVCCDIDIGVVGEIHLVDILSSLYVIVDKRGLVLLLSSFSDTLGFLLQCKIRFTSSSDSEELHEISTVSFVVCESG